MPRSYRKQSNYWQMPRKQVPIEPKIMESNKIVQAAPLDYEPSFAGDLHFSAKGACAGSDVSTTNYLNSAAPTVVDTLSYPNIRSIPIPLNTVEGNYSATDAINLTYQAYFGFAILRNAINLLVDFSVGRIHVKTQNKKMRTFINTWFDAIGLNQFQAQYYLEYYRSGNVFIYKFSGKISENGFNMLKESYSSLKESHAGKKSPVVPIRYTILNPMQVYLQRGASYTYGYVRMLSTYEIERLKNPQTEEDKQLLRSFPIDIQRQIQQGGAWRWLFVPLDQNRLYYVFYRKQDYEPLAVPLAFPVLNDIEFKLNLRRMDTALANTVSQVFMLITAGRAADQWNQVASTKQLQSLQNIFGTQTVGRVLVADYTTKAEWLIPDLKELLGPDKYQRVDQDIKEGLQYMFFGEEKFANASIKIRIFIEGLKEGRRAFIENFLLPEVKKICEIMNFRDIPELEYEKIQIQDEALMNRIYVQLAQLGILDPEETFVAMKTGMLPNKDDSIEAQTEYTDLRSKGLYTPLVGAPAGGAGMNGRPPGSGGEPVQKQVSTPIGQKKALPNKTSVPHVSPIKGLSKAGDISRDAKYYFGAIKVADSLVKMNSVKDDVEKALMKKWKLKELDAAQGSVAESVAKSIVFNEPEEKWRESVAAYVKAPKDLNDDTKRELIELGTEHDLDSWSIAILAKSKVDFPSANQG